MEDSEKGKLSFMGGAFTSRKGKISPEKKMEIVRRYLRGEVSQEGAAALVGVDGETLRDWLRIYRSEGASGLAVAEKERRYSSELKRKAVEEYLSGAGSQMGICKKYKIRSRTQLRNWAKVYITTGGYLGVLTTMEKHNLFLAA